MLRKERKGQEVRGYLEGANQEASVFPEKVRGVICRSYRGQGSCGRSLWGAHTAKHRLAGRMRLWYPILNSKYGVHCKVAAHQRAEN